jgi:DNA-binding transcriptional MerR regulator
MVDKAPDAFRNISEVSMVLNVPAHVLRFWETRFSQIRPVKRSGGRRYYRPADILLLTRIRDLLYAEGYTIKGAQQVLKSGESDSPSFGTASTTPPADAPRDAGTGADLKQAVRLLKEARTRLDRLKA